MDEDVIKYIEGLHREILDQFGLMIALRARLDDDDPFVEEFVAGEKTEDLRRQRATVELSCTKLIKEYRKLLE
jgi:hypothetical protein